MRRGEKDGCDDERTDLGQILQTADDIGSHKWNTLTMVGGLASPDPLVDAKSELPREAVWHFRF